MEQNLGGVFSGKRTVAVSSDNKTLFISLQTGNKYTRISQHLEMKAIVFASWILLLLCSHAETPCSSYTLHPLYKAGQIWMDFVPPCHASSKTWSLALAFTLVLFASVNAHNKDYHPPYCTTVCKDNKCYTTLGFNNPNNDVTELNQDCYKPLPTGWHLAPDYLDS